MALAALAALAGGLPLVPQFALHGSAVARLSVRAPSRLRASVRRYASNGEAAVASKAALHRVYALSAAGQLPEAAAAMDALTAEGLAVRQVPQAPDVGYQHVYEDHAMSIGIFLLPRGSAIPLHDHPGMTVLSKLLFGRLRVTSYDMPADRPSPSKTSMLNPFSRGRSAIRFRCQPPRTTIVAAPCSTLRLDPLCGNIHEFEALEDTAIFDVLTPPYNDRAGRSCHYYSIADASLDGSDEVELVEIPWPQGLSIVQCAYSGPKCWPHQ